MADFRGKSIITQENGWPFLAGRGTGHICGDPQRQVGILSIKERTVAFRANGAVWTVPENVVRIWDPNVSQEAGGSVPYGKGNKRC